MINSARYPFYERLDLRGTFRPRGDKGRWLFYVEILNALNRRNVSSIDATLDYDPTSDRPKLVLSPGGDLRRFPLFGVRFQFD